MNHERLGAAKAATKLSLRNHRSHRLHRFYNHKTLKTLKKASQTSAVILMDPSPKGQAE